MRIGQLRFHASVTVGEPESRPQPAAPDLPQGVLADIARRMSEGVPLPSDVLAWARATYGADLSQTRLHDGPEARPQGEVAATEGLSVGERQILLRRPGDGREREQETVRAEAVRAEPVLARRQVGQPGGAPGDIDLQRLADRVYDLLLDQLRRERERRL